MIAKVNLIVLILTIFISTHSIIHLRQAKTVSQRQLQQDGLIQMIQSNQNPYINKLNRYYYVLKVVHKEKSKAYHQMKFLFANIGRYLKKKKIIPNESDLVKSQTKPHYLNRKRKWQFSTIFVIYGNDEQQIECQKYFGRYPIQKLKSQPSINFLNKKVILLELFNKAKTQLLHFLKVFKEFQIKQVVQIQIKGSHIQNEDAIEEEIENSFNNESEHFPESIIAQEEPFQNDYIEARMLFKVGRIQSEMDSNQQQVEDEDEDESQESQTYSEQSE